MKLFTVRLTDEERAKLEAHRQALGLRSQSDIIRHWIKSPAPHVVSVAFDQHGVGKFEGSDFTVKPGESIVVQAGRREAQAETNRIASAAAVMDWVENSAPAERQPGTKPADHAHVNRMKGVWKAP